MRKGWLGPPSLNTTLTTDSAQDPKVRPFISSVEPVAAQTELSSFRAVTARAPVEFNESVDETAIYKRNPEGVVDAAFVHPTEVDYRKELRDEPWASQTERKIYDYLETRPGGASSILVDCRTTRCRVEIVTGDICLDPSEGLDQQEIRRLGAFQLLRDRIELAAGYKGWYRCPAPALYMTLLRDKPRED